jgi:hypothetical protein
MRATAQVKKFANSAISVLLALGSAAFVAYAMAHIAHYDLGIARSALREHALVCAALMVVLSYCSTRRSNPSDPMKDVEQTTFYLASAGVTALGAALLIRYGAGVAPAVLRLSALASAALLGVAVLLWMARSHEEKD